METSRGEWVIKFNGFSWTVNIKVHVIHIRNLNKLNEFPKPDQFEYEYLGSEQYSGTQLDISGRLVVTQNNLLKSYWTLTWIVPMALEKCIALHKILE